jgi:hypothetical protein
MSHLEKRDVTYFNVDGERMERDKDVKGITVSKQGLMDEDAI